MRRAFLCQEYQAQSSRHYQSKHRSIRLRCCIVQEQPDDSGDGRRKEPDSNPKHTEEGRKSAKHWLIFRRGVVRAQEPLARLHYPMLRKAREEGQTCCFIWHMAPLSCQERGWG
jgi:hypothetical protein